MPPEAAASSSAVLAPPAGGAPPAGAPPAGGTPPAGQAPPAGAPPAGTAPAWLPGADEATTGYVANKGWKEPGDVLSSYQNLEKLLGAERAGNTVILPKPDATPEEKAAFFNRLGRPQDPAGYQIKLPEGAPKEFATAAQAKMHELGLSKAQGEALAEWWNGQATASQAALQAQTAEAFKSEDAALHQEWGAAFPQNIAQAQAAVRGLGITTEQIDRLQAAMGHKATMEFFQKIGSKMGEADFVSGTGKEPFGNAMTPAQAKARMAELMKDKDFVARFAKGDTQAIQERNRLVTFMFPEDQQ